MLLSLRGTARKNKCMGFIARCQTNNVRNNVYWKINASVNYQLPAIASTCDLSNFSDYVTLFRNIVAQIRSLWLFSGDNGCPNLFMLIHV